MVLLSEMFDCEEQDKKYSFYFRQQSNKISNNTHNCSSDFALASIDQPKGFLKFVTHMFAFNYIKAPVFNNYLIYISNKLDWFFSLFSGSTLSIFISSTITSNQRKISTLIPSSKCKAKNYGCNYWTCTLQVVDLHELVLNLVCFMWASFHQTRFISFSLLPYP